MREHEGSPSDKEIEAAFKKAVHQSQGGKAEPEEKSFLCPFCGTSQKEQVSDDSISLKCRYCGATFFVPPEPGGTVQYCFNHEENQANGLCLDCKKSYCDQCLRVLTLEADKRLYLCSSCLRRRKVREGKRELAFGTLLISVHIFLLNYIPFSIYDIRTLPPSGYQQMIVIIALVLGFLSAGIWFLLRAVLSFHMTPEPTVHENKESER